MEALYTTIHKCEFSPSVTVTVAGIPIFKLILVALSPCWLLSFREDRLPKSRTGSKEGIRATATRNMLEPSAVFMRIFSLPEKDEERRSTSSVTVKLQACFWVGPELQEVTGSIGAVGLLSWEKTNRPTSSSQTSVWEHSRERII